MGLRKPMGIHDQGASIPPIHRSRSEKRAPWARDRENEAHRQRKAPASFTRIAGPLQELTFRRSVEAVN